MKNIKTRKKNKNIIESKIRCNLNGTCTLFGVASQAGPSFYFFLNVKSLYIIRPSIFKGPWYTRTLAINQIPF